MLLGRSTDLGETWSVLMASYEEAAEGEWGCAADSPSVLACSTRCLAEGCDPSMNMVVQENGVNAGAMNQNSNEQPNMGSGVDQSSEQGVDNPQSDSGCQMRNRDRNYDDIAMIILGLIMGVRIRRSNIDTRCGRHHSQY